MCRIDKGFVRDRNGVCVCPPGNALDINENCTPCRIEKGYKIDESGHCMCALERGMSIDAYGNCVCPIQHGYILTENGECITESRSPGCITDGDCALNRYCNLETKTCDDPCKTKVCGIDALCNATNHRAVCQCITGYTGNPEILCSKFLSLLNSNSQ